MHLVLHVLLSFLLIIIYVKSSSCCISVHVNMTKVLGYLDTTNCPRNTLWIEFVGYALIGILVCLN